MMRKLIVGLLVCVLIPIGWIGTNTIPRETIAQDQIGEQLHAIETRVADLEARVTALEEGAVPISDADAAQAVSDDTTVTVSGTGSTVTEDFPLGAGRYEVTVTVDSGCCITIFLYTPSGSDELLFNEIFGVDTQGGTATDIYQAPEPGTYFIDSQNTDGSWTVTFKMR